MLRVPISFTPSGLGAGAVHLLPSSLSQLCVGNRVEEKLGPSMDETAA
jgi:hypothetical protein